jgi:hypothetical protein
LHITDLTADLRDGTKLVVLLEVLADTSLPRYNTHPRLEVQRVANIAIVLEFLKEQHIQLVNIGPGDIEKGDLKLTLALLWAIILRYQIQRFGGDGGGGAEVIDENPVREQLLCFVNQRIAPYKMGPVTNFTTSFCDGRALLALCESFCPGTIDLAAADANSPEANVQVRLLALWLYCTHTTVHQVRQHASNPSITAHVS